jgi:hypothetical protein
MTRHQLARRARGAGIAIAATAAATLASSAPALAISAPPPPSPPQLAPTFVIGDQNAVIGSQVTFWGAQWWQDNPLSSGSAPAAFKGYADTVSGSCGGTWSTAPGNSSKPPADVSGIQDMIVSTQISQTGPVISGDIAEVVAVAVDPGYAADPGHPGTGTVVGYVCGGPTG